MDAESEIRLGPERISNGASSDFPGHRYIDDEDAAWDLGAFKKKVKIDVSRLTSDTIDFDLIGVDTSVANALRRCLIAEVPGIAVDRAYVFQNTSLVQDEILAHRIALVPIRFPPSVLRYRRDNAETTDTTTICFKLAVTCSHREDVEEGELDPMKLYENAHVYSSAMTWLPQGDQVQTWINEGKHERPRPAYDQVLLAKLRPGQEILIELHCELGRGSNHAKFSPVGTASYRLMPTIHIRQPIPSELCDKFAACFAKGVISVTGKGDKKRVKVVNPRRDTVSREVLRHPEFKDMVTLGRKRDHFIFSAESVGTYPPADLLPAAIGEMMAKINIVRSSLNRLEANQQET